MQKKKIRRGLWNIPLKITGKSPSPRWGHTTTVVTKEKNEKALFVFGGWDGMKALNDSYYYYIKEQVWESPKITGQVPEPRSGHTMCNINEVVNDKTVLIGGDRNNLTELYIFDFKKNEWQTQKTTSKTNVYIKDDLLVNERFIRTIKEKKEKREPKKKDKRKESKKKDETKKDNVNDKTDGKNEEKEEKDDKDDHNDDDDDDEAIPSPLASESDIYLGRTTAEIKDVGFGGPAKKVILNDSIVADMKSLFPPTRSRHTATFVPRKKKIYVFGGGGSLNGENKVYDDLWTLDVTKWIWEKKKTIGRVDALWGHSATLIGRHIFIFGGCHKTEMMNGLMRYNTDTNSWDNIKIDISNSIIPAPRAAHSCVAYGKNLIILWGGDNNLFLDDLYIINCEVFVCKKLSFTKPAARCAHTTNVVGDVMYVLGGGRDWRQRFKELYAVDLDFAIEKSGINELIQQKMEEIEEIKKLYDLGEGEGETSSASSSTTNSPTRENNSLTIINNKFSSSSSSSSGGISSSNSNSSSISNSVPSSKMTTNANKVSQQQKQRNNNNNVVSEPPVPPPLPKNFEFHVTRTNRNERAMSHGRSNNQEDTGFIPISSEVHVDRMYMENEDNMNRHRRHSSSSSSSNHRHHQHQHQHQHHHHSSSSSASSSRVHSSSSSSSSTFPQLQKTSKKEEKKMKTQQQQRIQKGNLNREIERGFPTRQRNRFKATEGEEDLPIVRWLSNIGLKKYTRIFMLNEIDMKSLEFMNEEDLVNIGITKVGPRKIIMNELYKMKEEHEYADNMNHRRSSRGGDRSSYHHHHFGRGGGNFSSSSSSSSSNNNVSSLQMFQLSEIIGDMKRTMDRVNNSFDGMKEVFSEMVKLLKSNKLEKEQQQQEQEQQKNSSSLEQQHQQQQYQQHRHHHPQQPAMMMYPSTASQFPTFNPYYGNMFPQPFMNVQPSPMNYYNNNGNLNPYYFSSSSSSSSSRLPPLYLRPSSTNPNPNPSFSPMNNNNNNTNNGVNNNGGNGASGNSGSSAGDDGNWYPPTNQQDQLDGPPLPPPVMNNPQTTPNHNRFYPHPPFPTHSNNNNNNNGNNGNNNNQQQGFQNGYD